MARSSIILCCIAFIVSLAPAQETDTYDRLWLVPGVGNALLIESLAEQGDDLKTPRYIEHTAAFRTRHQASKFIADVAEMGFSYRYISMKNDLSPYAFVVCFSRTDTPTRKALDQLTYQLAILCIGGGGEYRGWECKVVRNPG